MSKRTWMIVGALAAAAGFLSVLQGCSPAPPPPPPKAAQAPEPIKPPEPPPKPDYLRAVYSPLHFKPAIEAANDAQCLECHNEVLDNKVREKSPAGVFAKDSKAWYQQTSTYAGEQDTFHRRHMTSDFSKQLMDMKCTTCHQGNDPRDEAPGTSATGIPQTTTDVTLRKQVNPETVCLKCHGQHPYQLMGLPGKWEDTKEAMGNNCLACHAAIRTVRHQVTYLKAEAIEEAGKKDNEVCYGCHGGRHWYRIAYPYPRNPWPDMPPDTPDWAKDRPQASEARFLKTTAAPASAAASSAASTPAAPAPAAASSSTPR